MSGSNTLTNAVVYHSNTGQSKAVAAYLAERLGYALVEMNEEKPFVGATLVLVFPVHGQDMPNVVKTFLRRVSAENLAAVATYGKMCHGNVLQEIQKKYFDRVVAGAYVPAKHTYLEENAELDFSALEPLIEKIKCPERVEIPRSYQNPLASVLPKLRIRMSGKIVKSEACVHCGACEHVCAYKAMQNGKVGANCVRCLKCVSMCPQGALRFQPSIFLRLYLRKKKQNETVIYV